MSTFSSLMSLWMTPSLWQATTVSSTCNSVTSFRKLDQACINYIHFAGILNIQRIKIFAGMKLDLRKRNLWEANHDNLEKLYTRVTRQNKARQMQRWFSKIIFTFIFMTQTNQHLTWIPMMKWTSGKWLFEAENVLISQFYDLSELSPAARKGSFIFNGLCVSLSGSLCLAMIQKY